MSRGTRGELLDCLARRYPRGEYSAEGCYYDTHDNDSLNRILLDPLGPGNRPGRPAHADRGPGRSGGQGVRRA